MRYTIAALAVAASFSAIPVVANADEALQREAVLHGMRSGYDSVNISPDGTKIVFVAASKGDDSLAMVTDLATGKSKQVAFTDGEPFRLSWCDWATNKRIVCLLYGVTDKTRDGDDAGFTKLVTFDENGDGFIDLERKSRQGFVWDQTSAGRIISWLDDDTILVHRYHLPESSGGPTRSTSQDYGYAVDRVTLSTGKYGTEERPDKNAVAYIADKKGEIRIKGESVNDNKGEYREGTRYSYRLPGNRDWKPFSEVVDDQGLTPLAFSEGGNAVYAFENLNGRLALYRVSLDGSLSKELLLSDSQVDVDGLMTLGKRGRVIGAHYQAEKSKEIYFDKDLEAVVKTMSTLLPGRPDVQLISATEDERKLILMATTSEDTGRYFFYDRDSNAVKLLMYASPIHKGIALGKVLPVKYKAADGTEIPAYLTLPPGSDGKNLPGIMMPHGGPLARDTYSYDWLAQYFAARGYAVLQPNYRGSTGYGSEFQGKNAFREWKKAMGDINDGSRWLMSEGIVAQGKMAIFGWSYGGYAALQTSVVDPDLYKAIVAVAPVVDLEMLANDWDRGNSQTRKYTGATEQAEAGSPRRHADQIKAPVLLISGDADLNVNVRHTQEMEKALKRAGKKVDTIIYQDLDHQLDDSDTRIELLTRSDAWIRNALGLPDKK
ncbi:MAG: S9 family peptidase [Sphingomonadales bacterium]|nr:S9 family peptidase [Sphingomonadales bacterium]